MNQHRTSNPAAPNTAGSKAEHTTYQHTQHTSPHQQNNNTNNTRKSPQTTSCTCHPARLGSRLSQKYCCNASFLTVNHANTTQDSNLLVKQAECTWVCCRKLFMNKANSCAERARSQNEDKRGLRTGSAVVGPLCIVTGIETRSTRCS